ncbi:endoplasmic reticulum vesicle transporter-domain-containing protein [Cladochytrium replicatum]|nr:endoplasmic reticulum vesicle transporter-domain-containing protein [Cladochytrium replicatum]
MVKWNRFVALDAFPKIEKNYQNSTGSGGLLTIIVAVILGFLALSETSSYLRVRHNFDFLVDQSRTHDHALQINADITIAMNCKYVRIDVLDIAGASMNLAKDFTQTDTTFSAKDVTIFSGDKNQDAINVHKMVQQAHRESGGYRRSGIEATGACRIKGETQVNKVSGMLHVTATGHGYEGEHLAHDLLNFTHRIDRLSFGINYPGLRNPLDKSLELSYENMETFQYFISVVPTIYIDNRAFLGQKILLTNQYAVTDHRRVLRPEVGISGVPGLFFKYEIEPISVRVTESRERFTHFIVRLCGIIGGVFVCVGMVHHLVQWVTRMVALSRSKQKL